MMPVLARPFQSHAHSQAVHTLGSFSQRRCFARVARSYVAPNCGMKKLFAGAVTTIEKAQPFHVPSLSPYKVLIIAVSTAFGQTAATAGADMAGLDAPSSMIAGVVGAVLAAIIGAEFYVLREVALKDAKVPAEVANIRLDVVYSIRANDGRLKQGSLGRHVKIGEVAVSCNNQAKNLGPVIIDVLQKAGVSGIEESAVKVYAVRPDGNKYALLADPLDELLAGFQGLLVVSDETT